MCINLCIYIFSALLSLCCSAHFALKCSAHYTTTLSNLLYIWWKARVLLLPWYSFGRCLRSSHSLITRTTSTTTHLPTALRSNVSALKFSHQWWEFYKRPVKTSAGRPSEDLTLMGREESEVWFTSCKQFVNTPLTFYSTSGAELPATSECSFDATNSRYFGGMPPSMHTIDGVET